MATPVGLLAVGVSALVPRQQAPDFTATAVINQKFEEVNFAADYKGKWKVLLFYPFDFTFVCPTEILSFSANVPKLQEIGAEVLAISTDSHHTHLNWIRTARKDGGLGEDLKIPLVADMMGDISKDYGVLVTEKGDGMYGAALRGLFIIDPTQKVRAVQIYDDQVGRSVEEVIRLIKAYQYADEHGEVCPAGWTPGAKTMKPDPDLSKEYFKSVN